MKSPLRFSFLVGFRYAGSPLPPGDTTGYDPPIDVGPISHPSPQDLLQLSFNAVEKEARYTSFLAPIYTNGLMEKMTGAWGAYVVMGPEIWTSQELQHEMHHIWQSRSFSDPFLLHYALQGIAGSLIQRDARYAIRGLNYFETQAYGHYWFNP